MKIIDYGHKFELAHLDGDGHEVLTFVKREGPKYPNNKGHYEGTNLQEVIRALISRVKYLEWQVRDWRNPMIIGLLRTSLYLLEQRAADKHNRKLPAHYDHFEAIEDIDTCSTCGHIGCNNTCK